MLKLLVAEGTISETIAALMQTWRYGGSAVHNAVRVRGHDAEGRMKLALYLLRAPFSLEKMSEADRRRLGATEAPQGWLTLKHAASALGVSQQTVLNKLKLGQLNAVRVCER